MRLRWSPVLCAPVLYGLLSDLAVTPYDDGYFFKRFALNWLRHGMLAWNVADGPVHGISSQLFLLVATSLTWCFPDHFVLACKLVSGACLCATAWLLAQASAKLAQSAAAGAMIALLVLANPPVLATVHSCMETALALLLLTWSLRWVADGDDKPAGMALRTLLVYLCRPDAALIPAIAYGVAHRRERARLLPFVLVLIGGLGIWLAACRVYYGTALPLPFYLKSWAWTSYGDEMARLTLRSKLQHLATFLAFAAPLLLVAARRARAPAAALAIAALVFVAYHAFGNNEIMGYRARFYLPALIPLALCAALSWGGFRARHGIRGLVVLGAAWIALIAIGERAGLVDPKKERPHARALPASFEQLADRAFLARSSAEVTTTRGLAELARCLPHVAQVYHSELGVIGLVLPDARIVDLAGLMSERIALQRPPFDDDCLHDRPEALFLPHKNYAALNSEIMRSACIRDYTRVVERSSSPLYIRNDLAPRFVRCARR